MPVLSDLEPREVFAWFERLCAIPHGSHHAKAISDYLVAFAREHGLACRQDAANNVVIRKAASAGYENAPVVMLQGHIDMVCEKDADCGKDMETEGLDLFVDGDVIGARGTTLGGDDGIAVAMALAVLDADDIPHGPLECVFTADEEVGMIGARALDASDLKAKYLINIDSEEEGVLTVSCAGACRMACTLPVTRAPFDGQTLRVRISGLAGGHSGEEIHKGRANANLLLGRALDEMSRAGALRLIRVSGGAKDNAIPREAEAVVLVETGDYDEFAAAVKAYEETVRAEYAGIEDAVSVKVAEVGKPAEMLPKEVAGNLIKAVAACPDGVQRMSVAMPGLVQTSTNLARVVSDGRTVKLQCLLRSSVNTEKEALGESIAALFALAGAKTELTGAYNGWNPDMESPILKAMTASYEALYGKKPAVTAIHAGLECGIIGSAYPGLDMISFGPTICYPHSPDEKVEIASVGKFYEFMVDTLRNIPKK